jgi:hypothetical protein
MLVPCRNCFLLPATAGTAAPGESSHREPRPGRPSVFPISARLRSADASSRAGVMHGTVVPPGCVVLAVLAGGNGAGARYENRSDLFGPGAGHDAYCKKGDTRVAFPGAWIITAHSRGAWQRIRGNGACVIRWMVPGPEKDRPGSPIGATFPWRGSYGEGCVPEYRPVRSPARSAVRLRRACRALPFVRERPQCGRECSFLPPDVVVCPKIGH